MTPRQRAVAARAASVLLRHPDSDVLAALPTVCAAVAGLPGDVARRLGTVADHLAAGDPAALAAAYAQTFDFRRRCTLYLTYYTHGDTRARGQALAEVAAEYREAGYALDRELPDFLPAVLELAAVAGQPGWRVLHAYRLGVDLLEAALEREGSVYAHAVAAVRRLLPPQRAADAEAVRRLAAAGPPAELVGLEAYHAAGPLRPPGGLQPDIAAGPVPRPGGPYPAPAPRGGRR
ncbi:MAG TPA: nitrate reductase molybdenum cofactor assembly chaperone [Natronosporangium sp.]|nr:nitrate reductase molybdenum cofactor assembly chaperone [Natronosporangium sp.]